MNRFIAEASRPPPYPSYLSAQFIDINYGATKIVHQLSFAPPAGKVTALIGPNGCGKSTLLKSFARILRPSAGGLFLNGDNYAGIDAKTLARSIAFLPQILPLPQGITVRQLVAYGRSPHNNMWGRLTRQDKQHIDSALARMSLHKLADRDVADLSGGQRQRVWLAMILAQNAAVILLDEPTTYLDISHQIELLELMQTLSQEGKTVVTVLHDINQAARYADQLAVMQAGHLTFVGTPREVLTADNVSCAFNVDVQIHDDPAAGTPMCIIEKMA